jgi:hypothetical protein
MPDESVARPRVVIKFKSSSGVPYEDHLQSKDTENRFGTWEQLESLTGKAGIDVNRLFTCVSPELIQSAVSEAQQRDPTYRDPGFLTYFVVNCPGGIDPEALAKIFSGWQAVQKAYVAAGPCVLPDVALFGDREEQGYLAKAPQGIDADIVQKNYGDAGLGYGIQFIDVEQGWVLNHKDLPGPPDSPTIPMRPGGVNKLHQGHGTSVLSIIAARPGNLKGLVGLVPLAACSVDSEWREDGSYSPECAIMDAVTRYLGFGDVLLLEDERPGTRLPREMDDHVFDAVRLGTARGIVIVEPAGNGGRCLDTDARTLTERDSGAIMVGAAHYFHDLRQNARCGFSNYGTRINCFSWGDHARAAGDGGDGVSRVAVNNFDGTSSAAAIIAGAAVAVQAIAKTRPGKPVPLTPKELRLCLSNSDHGTWSYEEDESFKPGPGPFKDKIGVMPDLKCVLEALVKGAL